jgi:hypothetical protein
MAPVRGKGHLAEILGSEVFSHLAGILAMSECANEVAADPRMKSDEVRP